MEKSVKMKDVAKLAGVSIQTVSTVLNGKPGITRETSSRVLAAVEALNYRPYSVARSLRTRKTRTIALVVSDIANPSFARMASAAEDIAHSNGYSLVLYNTHDDTSREEDYMRTAIERWVDGVVFVSAKDQMSSLAALEAAGIPSVAVDRIPDKFSGPSVTLDNIKAGRIAAEHLIGLGHRYIAQITGPLDLRLARERRDGFNQAVAERGLTSQLCPSWQGTWECHTGYEAMMSLLSPESRPTAVFAANDRMAIGAMRAIAEHGLSVPDDVSVVGLDDIEVAAYQTPPLTTIRQSFDELARLGVELLLNILAARQPERLQIQIEPSLVLRGSTAALG